MTNALVRRITARPRTTLVGALLFLLVAGFVGGGVAASLTDDGFVLEDSPSAQAEERLAEATGLAPDAGIVLLVDTSTDTSTDTPAGAAEISAVEAELAAIHGIARTASPVSAPGSGLAAPDGDSAIVAGTLTAEADDGAVTEDVLAAFEDEPDVSVGGPLVANEQIGAQVGEDLARAELIAMPILVLLCLLFFGLRGALLPLAVGASTVLGTFLVIAGINQAYPMSVFALNLIMGLGLGLAIDYTLFVLTRFRDELDAGADPGGAIAVTMRTAGRTVLFSAATVSAAMITLTLFPQGFVKSMGIAGAVVSLVAALSTMVLGPALLALFGRRLAHRRPRATSDTGGWYRLATAVMRRPGLVAVTTALVMIALAAPALRAHWTPIDGSVIPPSQSARTVSDALEADYSGSGTTSVTVAIEATGSEASADVAAYAEQAGTLAGAPATAEQVGPHTWLLELPVEGAPEDDAAQQLVQDLRAVDSQVDARVGGPAAAFIDQQEALARAMPLALGLLVALTMLVLWLMTGSVILPIKAVLMNVLTVGSALGLLTLIYQDGRLTSLLDYTPNGGVEPTDFVVSAAVVFALSTDYGVFLLGRIKELRDAGLGEREAVAVGVQRTGHVVTAAAILLAVAIGVFSTSSISFIQQIGVAVAFGVLIDAFVVRTFLVPSLMGLLGRWNWWAPMPLRRLHDRIGLAEPGPVDYSQETMTDTEPRPTVQR
ncbi:MMPL family transporter [Nocardioides insulae]|uniref:MMPL family transporter n=1 Tax=Nocardioides insulae TaxID=394734 RepID=UPI0003FD5A14|nr:MMPL family transporter [Nocardioides insulae]